MEGFTLSSFILLKGIQSMIFLFYTSFRNEIITINYYHTTVPAY